MITSDTNISKGRYFKRNSFKNQNTINDKNNNAIVKINTYNSHNDNY